MTWEPKNRVDDDDANIVDDDDDDAKSTDGKDLLGEFQLICLSIVSLGGDSLWKLVALTVLVFETKN